tara:strand:- start:1251 stop:1724 length:474 start_codon:yes stop_codon:yes gene_type:complete
MNIELPHSADQIIKDFHFLREKCPEIAKAIGVKKFCKELFFTMPQYYRRIKNPDLWTIDELTKVYNLALKNNLISFQDIRIQVPGEDLQNEKKIELSADKISTAQIIQLMDNLKVTREELSNDTEIGISTISRALAEKGCSTAKKTIYYYLVAKSLL